MKYRRLGKTGLSVSELGLGTAQIGGVSLIGGRYVGASKIDEHEALDILEHAYDAGINFYDSSDKYGDGQAERYLGKAFSSRRGKVILATKCGITETGKRCFEKKYIRSCIEQSLKNMQTDYIDVFQLSKPDIGLIRSGDVYDTFDELKREGKIRFSGVSTGTDEETMQLIADNKVDTLQIFYNLLHIRPNELFISKAFNAGLGLIVRSPLSSGVLTGKFTSETEFSKEDDRYNFLHGKTLVLRVDMVKKLEDRFKLGEYYNIMDLSLNYLLSNDNISTIIPGVSRLSQLAGILRLCAIKRMDQELLSEVEEFVRTHYQEDKQHTSSRYKCEN